MVQIVEQRFIVDNQIITLKDNLFHPYFSSVSVSKDASYPVGICKLEMPYMQEALDYWMKYEDIVVVSISINETNKNEYLNALEQQSKIKNDYYNYSFIGKIQKVKHKGNKVIVYLEDIGWKFEQKVPKDFRQGYIAGRTLDEAFQAICEFIDVRFCYSIEDLHKYTFAEDGYSIQKDGQTLETVQNIFEIIKSETKIPENVDNPHSENEGLFDYEQKAIDALKNTLNKSLQDNVDENDQNDDEKALDKKIQKYEKDFKQKIQDLFTGNKYYESNLTSTLLNYGAITLEPKTTTTPTSDNDGNTEGDDENGDTTGGTGGTTNTGGNTQTGSNSRKTYSQIRDQDAKKAAIKKDKIKKNIENFKKTPLGSYISWKNSWR